MSQSNLAKALKDKGNVFMQEGKPEKAIAAYQEAIKTDPAYIPAYANLGMVYAMTGKLDQAEKVYLDAIKIAPDDHRVLTNAGIFYLRTGNSEKAIDLLNKKLEDISDDVNEAEGGITGLYLATAYLQENNCTKALHALFSVASAVSEANPDALGMLEETFQEYLLDNDNSSPEAICIQGLLELIDNMEDQAADTIQGAIKANGKFAEAWFCLGLVLGAQYEDDSPFDDKTNKRKLKAIEAFETAIRLKPEWSEAYYKVGILSLQLTDLESPLRAYNALSKAAALAKKQKGKESIEKQAEELLANNKVLKAVSKL